MNSFLPTFAIVGSAGEHDNKRARELCAGLKEGEVVVFDKAYVDFAHLHDLDLRGVQWVTRAKDNLRYRALRNMPVVKGSGIVKDQIVKLTGTKWKSLSGLDRAAGRGMGGGRWREAPDGLHHQQHPLESSQRLRPLPRPLGH